MNIEHRIKNEEVKHALNNLIIWILFLYSLFIIIYSILKKCHYYFPIKIYNRLIIIYSVRKSDNIVSYFQLSGLKYLYQNQTDKKF